MIPYFDDGQITIYCGDCRDVLPNLDAADLVLTDPPYGLPKGSAVVRKNTMVVENWDDVAHNVYVDGWHGLIQLSVSAAVVQFSGGSLSAIDRTREAHRLAGWIEWRLFILGNAAPPPHPRPTLVASWDAALISYVGKRPWYGGGYVLDSWLGLTPNRLNQAEHPTQKPIQPIRSLMQALSPEGAMVLDPFMGSGTTLRAAKDLGRRAIGIEIEERYCEIAVKRLRQAVLPLEVA